MGRELRQMGWVDVFRHVVPYECDCIVSFVKFVCMSGTNGIECTCRIHFK